MAAVPDADGACRPRTQGRPEVPEFRHTPRATCNQEGRELVHKYSSILTPHLELGAKRECQETR